MRRKACFISEATSFLHFFIAVKPHTSQLSTLRSKAPPNTKGRDTMLHIYYGSGKGKTCCAVGSAVRAAGQGLKVLFVQLFKTEQSGERSVLKALDGITLTPCPDKLKFTFQMNNDELTAEKDKYRHQLDEISEKSTDYDMIVIDEFFTLADCGFFDTDYLLSFITSIYNEKELILTGHTVDSRFISLADYATHFECQKHPYEAGVKPRRGIEF